MALFLFNILFALIFIEPFFTYCYRIVFSYYKTIILLVLSSSLVFLPFFTTSPHLHPVSVHLCPSLLKVFAPRINLPICFHVVRRLLFCKHLAIIVQEHMSPSHNKSSSFFFFCCFYHSFLMSAFSSFYTLK